MLTPATVVASAARTASSTSGSLPVRDTLERGVGVSHLNLQLDVTSVAGATPTLDITVEWSNDGTTFSAADGTADTFAQVTAASSKVKRFTVKAAYYRIKWTVAGTTPSFTFSVTALETP